jgi:hypothetical protein
MKFEIHHYHHPRNAEVAEMVQQLFGSILERLSEIMATLDQVLQDVSDQTTQITSLQALILGLKQQIADALSGVSLPSGAQVKIDQIFQNLEANKAGLANALNAGTPAAAVNPLIPATPVNPADPTNPANPANPFNPANPVPGDPVVSSISPTVGPLAGSTTITLTGTGFTGATSVTVGGVSATSVVVVNDTSITAVTPAGTGSGPVIVTTPTGVSGNATVFAFA